MNRNPSCPKCKSDQVIKSEKVQGKQRVRCKHCNYQFTRLTPRGHPSSEKSMAVILYTLGLSMNVIAKLFKVSTPAVLTWIKNFAIANYEKPVPKDAILIEIDEMWHFLKSKKRVWIWKAYCRETGKIVDWQCGGRDKKTFMKLWKRLLKWNIELFCTDGYDVYARVIPDDKLFQSKSQTIFIERNNGRQRHWFARFRRKSIVVSKTLEMINLTMGLFARFHVNGSWTEIPALFS